MNGTQSVAVDVTLLTQEMRARGIEVAGRLSLARVGFGLSNLTYRATDEAGASWIIRRPPLGELLASAHDVEREHRILSALGPTEVPVPVMFAALPQGAVADVPVVVMEHVDGVVVDGFEGLGDLAPELRLVLVPDLARVLASIHAVHVDAVGLGDLASRRPYADRQLKRWSAQWAQSRTRELLALDDLTRALTTRAPRRAAVSLLHGDYSPRNVIIDRTGAIRSVLDWELSTLGDPLADVGTVLAYWSIADEKARQAGSTTEASEVDRRRFLAAYLDASGEEGLEVSYWQALGLWKLAIITEGVMRRAMDEPANAASMGVPEPRHVDQLVEMATRVLDEEGD